MKNSVIKGRDGLSFLNLKESPKAKVASKDSTLENQINNPIIFFNNFLYCIQN